MEYSLLYHTIIPFALSALVVILVTIIAEKYGTKTGGVIGTLPSTIIIAFLFIALDKGVQFASESVAVVPAEMGINLVFLLIFALLSQKKNTCCTCRIAPHMDGTHHRDLLLKSNIHRCVSCRVRRLFSSYISYP